MKSDYKSIYKCYIDRYAIKQNCISTWFNAKSNKIQDKGAPCWLCYSVKVPDCLLKRQTSILSNGQQGATPAG